MLKLSPPSQDPDRRVMARLVVLAIVALGLFIRLPGLTSESLWEDEGYSVAIANEPVAELLSLTAKDRHPPLYYLLLKVWMGLAGSGEYSLRFLSVAIGTLLIPISWVFAYRWLGSWGAFPTALLFTLSPFYREYSQEVRMYGLATLFLMACGYLGKRVLDDHRLQWPFVLSALAAGLTHYFAFLSLAGLVGGLLIAARLQGVSLKGLARSLALPAAIAGALAGGWLGFVLASDGPAPPEFWWVRYPASQIVSEMLVLLPLGSSDWVETPWLWIFETVTGLSLVLLGRRTTRAATGFLWVWLALGLGATILFPTYNPRYMTVFAPPYFGLIGAGIYAVAGSGRNRARTIMATALGLLLLLALGMGHAAPSIPRDDYRDLAKKLSESGGFHANDPVIFLHGGAKYAFDYYSENEGPYFLAPTERPYTSIKDLPGLPEFVNNASRVWLIEHIVTSDFLLDPHDIISNYLEEAFGSPVFQTQVQGLRASLYGRW